MSLVDEEDLAVLCSKLKPFQSKLLRKWVQGLGAEQGVFVKIKKMPSGTTLSWQCSRSTTNAISKVLLFCVCVCVCVMRYIFICILFSLGVRCVCVCVCVCVCIYLSTYVSIYMFLVLAVPEVPVLESAICVCVCVYYCSTYEKAVRVGGLV
jgi:hypothetical protein